MVHPGPLPPLATTVVGSYPVPEWMERLKTDFFRGRMSRAQLEDVHDMAVKAALRDQERAGIDVVSDGELRRDNDLDYFLARIPGIGIAGPAKDFYFDYYDTHVGTPLPEPGAEPALRLADDFAFTAAQTDRPIKFSFTGPYSLARRVRDEAYRDDRGLTLAIARHLNAEARALVARGAAHLQIDEPFLAGRPDEVKLAVEAINVVTEGVDASWGLHVCWGNRYARPSWEGHYDFLFPAVLEANVDRLVLEFARTGFDDLPILERSGWDRGFGIGVIDVKSTQVETPELVATRIRRALEFLPADRLTVNPDCGLRHLPGVVARAKLEALVAGAELVRAELPVPEPDPGPAADPAAEIPADLPTDSTPETADPVAARGAS